MDTNTFIVKCPHCKATKKIGFSVNTASLGNYEFWSDSRIEGGGWIEPAYTQQCPVCGKFYTLPPRNTLKTKKEECKETGFLSYPLLKSAVREFAGDEIPEARARLEAWWAFNSLYNEPSDAPIEEQEYNRANMQWLIDYHTPRATRFSHLLFELNRLMGNKEVCEQMIEDLTFEEYVRQRNERHKERGFISKLDDQWVRDMYDSEIKELKFAMEQPLKTYIKYPND